MSFKGMCDLLTTEPPPSRPVSTCGRVPQRAGILSSSPERRQWAYSHPRHHIEPSHAPSTSSPLRPHHYFTLEPIPSFTPTHTSLPHHLSSWFTLGRHRPIPEHCLTTMSLSLVPSSAYRGRGAGLCSSTMYTYSSLLAYFYR